MAPPRFSGVLPTPETAPTLRPTPPTRLQQDFAAYEIVVSDNHSSPATREGGEAASAIARVITFEECYTTLPMIYNAVVHRDLIAALRSKTGCVFANNCPDVYSGFAFGYLAGTYLSVDAPMTVAGLSGNSTGVA